MLHCGGKPATREELDLIPTPEETATYKPVGHFALTTQILTISQDLLKPKTATSYLHWLRSKMAMMKWGFRWAGGTA
jgi:hypothetical protein